MKKEFLSHPGSLWKFVKDTIPKSLTAEEIQIGYGKFQVIYRIGHKRGIMDRLLEQLGDPVATVGTTTIEIFHPEYFSDFENIAQRYEHATAKEVLLKCWEAI